MSRQDVGLQDWTSYERGVVMTSTVWAFVILILVGAALWLLNQRVKDVLELRNKQHATDRQVQGVELAERQRAAALATQTLPEEAEARKAELALRAAEDRTAAQVAEAPETISARIAEEQKVIAARAEGRALAAHERAASEGDLSAFQLLMNGYGVYRQTGGTNTLQAWLNGLSLGDILGYAQDGTPEE